MKKLLLPTLIVSLLMNIILTIALVLTNIKTDNHETESIASVNTYNRHDYEWYKKNTLRQIVSDDYFNTFKDGVTEATKIYVVAQIYSSGESYAEFDRMYYQYFGEHLKKQDYYLNDCYDYKYSSGGLSNKSIYVDEFGAKGSQKWSQNCYNHASHTLRYYDILSIDEKNDGYTAKMYYAELAPKTNEKTDEVWYEFVDQKIEKTFDCGYDIETCNYGKIEEYIKENKESFTVYEATFKTIDDIEAIVGIEKE